jgi:G3E family GTPase
MSGNDPEVDKRSITQLMIDQIEFANVIVVSKASIFLSSANEARLQEVKTLLQKLNPKARVIVPLMDNYGDLDVAEELLNTGSFDMEEAENSAGWLLELAKPEHTPETEEYGISSMVFRCNTMPFHPERLAKILDGFGDYKSATTSGSGSPTDGWPFEGVVRAKGRLWLANANAFPMEIHTAGKMLHIGVNMPFLAAIIDQDSGPGTENEKKMFKSALMSTGRWSPKFGDRYSELVCIGVNLNKELIEEKLTAALLTEEENLALGGVEGWKGLKDLLFEGKCAEFFFEHSEKQKQELMEQPNRWREYMARRPTHVTRICGLRHGGQATAAKEGKCDDEDEVKEGAQQQAEQEGERRQAEQQHEAATSFPAFNNTKLAPNSKPLKAGRQHLQEVAIGEWLGSISSSSSLRTYTGALVEYGYSDTHVLFELEREDLREALEDLEVKPAHRKLILRAFQKAAAEAPPSRKAAGMTC